MTEIWEDPDKFQDWAMTKWNGTGFQFEYLHRLAEDSEARRLEARQREWIEQIVNAALGLMGEGGEYADLVKKIAFHNAPIGGAVGHDNNDKLKKELGDLAYYLAVNARLWGWDLSQILAANVHKLNARYPEGFSAERSNNRNEAAE